MVYQPGVLQVVVRNEFGAQVVAGHENGFGKSAGLCVVVGGHTDSSLIMCVRK